MKFMGSRRFARRSGWDGAPLGQRLWGRVSRFAEQRTMEMYDAAATAATSMQDAAVDTRRGTRKRALPVAALGLVALAGMYTLVSENVLAVNFTTANTSFNLYSNYLDAQQAAGYLDSTSRQDGNNVGVAELGINTAKLAGLCAIATQSLPVIGSVSLMIKAGDQVQPSFTGTAVPTGVTTDSTTGQLNGTSLANAITASNLYINATALTGYGNKISGLNLGQSADTVAASAAGNGNTVTFPASGAQAPVTGNFGLYANQLNVAGLGGNTYGLNLAGQITLPKLAISVLPGSKDQTAC